jgi:hypothetical protein
MIAYGAQYVCQVDDVVIACSCDRCVRVNSKVAFVFKGERERNTGRTLGRIHLHVQLQMMGNPCGNNGVHSTPCPLPLSANVLLMSRLHMSLDSAAALTPPASILSPTLAPVFSPALTPLSTEVASKSGGGRSREDASTVSMIVSSATKSLVNVGAIFSFQRSTRIRPSQNYLYHVRIVSSKR